MRVRAICFFPFCFINLGNTWRTVVNWNNISLLGASVVEQFEIKDKNDFKRMTRAYANSMLSATLSGIFMTILGFILFIVGFIYRGNEAFITFACLLIAVNIVLVSSSFTRNENASGDFFAYKYIFKDEEISAQVVFSYMKMSANYYEIRKNSKYLRDMLVCIFEKKIKKNTIDIDAISIATSFINDFLIIKIPLAGPIEKYIKKFGENVDRFSEIKNIEIYRRFIVIVAYYYEYIGNNELAEKIYHDYISQFSNKAVDNYLKIQAEQIILKKDNSEVLNIRKNIKPDSYYTFYRLFDGYINDEIFLNQKLRNSKSNLTYDYKRNI
jgi:hypothetical protein